MESRKTKSTGARKRRVPDSTKPRPRPASPLPSIIDRLHRARDVAQVLVMALAERDSPDLQACASTLYENCVLPIGTAAQELQRLALKEGT